MESIGMIGIIWMIVLELHNRLHFPNPSFSFHQKYS